VAEQYSAVNYKTVLAKIVEKINNNSNHSCMFFSLKVHFSLKVFQNGTFFVFLMSQT
jgi:hypothetical protein